MLFDLRGAGRRRTVQAIYLALAILMGGGLVLFGVGGNVGGGLFDALNSNGSSSSNSFEKRVKGFEKRVQVNPRDAHSWSELARARFQDASSGAGFDQTQGTFTDKGKQKLRGAEQAWDRYLALNPKQPDPQVANIMVQVFGPGGLNELDKATSAMEVVVNARPKSYALYAQLAQLAYLAGQTRKGDLAAGKATDLAPKDQKATVKDTLAQAKTQAAQQQIQQATGGGATAP
jgi:hypothetical protein